MNKKKAAATRRAPAKQPEEEEEEEEGEGDTTAQGSEKEVTKHQVSQLIQGLTNINERLREYYNYNDTWLCLLLSVVLWVVVLRIAVIVNRIFFITIFVKLEAFADALQVTDKSLDNFQQTQQALNAVLYLSLFLESFIFILFEGCATISGCLLRASESQLAKISFNKKRSPKAIIVFF